MIGGPKLNQGVPKVLLLDKGLKTALETAARFLVAPIPSEEKEDKMVSTSDTNCIDFASKSIRKRDL